MTLTRLLAMWAFTVVTALASLITDLSTARGISGMRDVLGVAFPLALAYSYMMTGRMVTMFRKMAKSGLG